MKITDMDCTTMSYLVGVILLGLGAYMIIMRQFSVRSGTSLGRHNGVAGASVDNSRNYIPSAALAGLDAILFGVFLIGVALHMFLKPGVLLCAFQVCKP
jgi:hypothetical protein